MSAPALRTWWKWTIVANLAGIAILLIGRATGSGVPLVPGFIVLVSSLGVRIAAQLSGRRRPRENCPYRVVSSSELPANAQHLVLLESESVPRFLTTDEVEIRFEVLGTGPPLLVCHGGPSNVCDTLISDLAGLSPHFTLVFHDYRGSGQSSSAPEDTTRSPGLPMTSRSYVAT